MNIIRGNSYSYEQGATHALLINHQNDGIYTGRTNRGIPSLLPSEGNSRDHTQGPKGHSAAIEH
jgi:hypothetical protein